MPLPPIQSSYSPIFTTDAAEHDLIAQPNPFWECDGFEAFAPTQPLLQRFAATTSAEQLRVYLDVSGYAGAQRDAELTSRLDLLLNSPTFQLSILAERKDLAELQTVLSDKLAQCKLTSSALDRFLSRGNIALLDKALVVVTRAKGLAKMAQTVKAEVSQELMRQIFKCQIDPEYLVRLLSRGADPNQVDEEGFTLLCRLTKRSELKAMQVLIDAGAKVDSFSKGGWTPLCTAADKGNLGAVNIFLGARANVNLCDNDGWSPLHSAARCKNPAVTKALLEAGANVQQTYMTGWSPLHAGAKANQPLSLSLLIDASANINARDEDGWTPLFTAARAGHSASINVLLASGADPTIPDFQGRTPLQIAKEKGYAEAVALLSGTAKA